MPPYGGYVIVTGKNGGGTNYQAHYVYIARRLEVRKFNEATRVTLRNRGGRIEVDGLQ